MLPITSLVASRASLCSGRAQWTRVARASYSARLISTSAHKLNGKNGDKEKKEKKKKRDGSPSPSSRWPKQWPREILHKDLEAAVLPRLTTIKDAKRFLKRLGPEEKELLQAALAPVPVPAAGAAGAAADATDGAGANGAEAEEEDPGLVPPTANELYHLALHQSLPFIGFGFLDNLIMIMAGEYIDHTIGLTLGISTMAAAALGNTISDVFGIGSAWYVEHFCSKLGVRPPSLTLEQLEMSSSRMAANLGRALGVMIGCLIGMTPLLLQ